MPSLLIASSATVLAFILIVAVVMLCAMMIDLETVLRRVLVCLISAGLALPVGLLIVNILFPHLGDPADWGELFAGVEIVFATCMGGIAAGGRLQISRERAQVRRKLEPDVERIRKEERWKLETLTQLAQDDPTLAPLLRQLESNVLLREEYMQKMGIPPRMLPPSGKSTPPKGQDEL